MLVSDEDTFPVEGAEVATREATELFKSDKQISLW